MNQTQDPNKVSETNKNPKLRVTEHIRPHMAVVCSNDVQFGTVDRIEGNSIKLTKDGQGVHHFIPASWVKLVDDKVHIDRPGKQAMSEWTTRPQS